MSRIDIPIDWLLRGPAHFVTYYGDIYHGIVKQLHGFDDRFFILSVNQLQEFQGLQKHTLEDYQRLTWEIRDSRIIKKMLPQLEIGNVGGNIDTTRRGNQQWKRMFVFGAGASKHCLFGKDKNQDYNTMKRPPLGNEIFDRTFDDTIQHFEGARLSAPFFEARGNDIEGSLEDEWQNLRNAYNPNITARHISLQFYLQTLFKCISADVVRGYYRNNLYSLFANKLQNYLAGKDERVALVSFNYETILDEFVAKIFNAPFRTMADYIDYNTRQVILFKPHGSSNWGWPAKNYQRAPHSNQSFHQTLYEQRLEPWEIYYQLLGDFDSMVYNHAWGYERTNHKHNLARYTVNKNKIEVMDHSKGYDYFPSLLMPYRDKDEFVMHYDHHTALRWFVSEIEELYLIGWKGNEELFNRMIKEQAASVRVIFVGSSPFCSLTLTSQPKSGASEILIVCCSWGVFNLFSGVSLGAVLISIG
jgi:hypothetical protein